MGMQKHPNKSVLMSALHFFFAASGRAGESTTAPRPEQKTEQTPRRVPLKFKIKEEKLVSSFDLNLMKT